MTLYRILYTIVFKIIFLIKYCINIINILCLQCVKTHFVKKLLVNIISILFLGLLFSTVAYTKEINNLSTSVANTINNKNNNWLQNKRDFPILWAKTNYYQSAAKYFTQRKHTLHHYIDLGIGATLIESFYPFETTAYPFLFYLNYRREKWGNTKIPIIVSFQYVPSVYTFSTILIGIRNPLSTDLKLSYIDFMIGVSFSIKSLVQKTTPEVLMQKTGLELRVLYLKIIGPKNSDHRLYFKLGPKLKLTTEQWSCGLIIQVGIDNHL